MLYNMYMKVLLDCLWESYDGERETKNCASAGNRTWIYCLEGNNANLYTTDALEEGRIVSVAIL